MIFNWDEPDTNAECDAYDKMIEKVKAKDCYFQLFLDNDTPYSDHYFIIVPKKYFDRYKCMPSIELPINIFPSNFGMMSEDTYEYDGDKQVGRNLLLQAGFIEKKMY